MTGRFPQEIRESSEAPGHEPFTAPDPIFAQPRLAQIYDALDGERIDLDAYLAIASEVGAESVLDIGCGTGELARRLAERGLAVTGVDPAVASLEVARAKSGTGSIRWVRGVAADALPIEVDLVTMTGNVAQVFVDDEAWHETLSAARSALVPSGHLVFEVRDPAARAWEEWTPDGSRSTTDTAHGPVESWVEVLEVEPALVTFRWTFRFLADDSVLTSDSTLRFRSRIEITTSLERAGFGVADVRDAPDRLGHELVFVARPTAHH